jgi:hypothetical protein
MAVNLDEGTLNTVSRDNADRLVILINGLKRGVDSYTPDILHNVLTDYFKLVTLCECVKNLSLTDYVAHSCHMIMDRYETVHTPFCKCCQTRVFLDYLGRYLEDRNDTNLTKAKIRDRTFGFQVHNNRVRFKIVRHLNAFHEDRELEEIIQIWEFDFRDLTFKEIETEDSE